MATTTSTTSTTSTTTSTTTRNPLAWSARQARYNTGLTTRTTSNGGGLEVDFVPTRHGLVARTWVGDGLCEVALLRRSGSKTFQGCVEVVPGGWKVTDARGNVLGVKAGDFLDAEAPLLRLRTGCRSHGDYRWPAGLRSLIEAGRTDW